MGLRRERLTYSVWGTAYAMARGVRLLRVFKEPGSRKASFALADDYGEATEALQQWWQGDPMIGGRSLVEARRIVLEKMKYIEQQTEENTTHAAAVSTAAN
jgi:hypothetical protein